MNIKVWLICALTLGLLQTALIAQEVSVTPAPERGYLVGPGDVITGKVMNEPQFDFVATIDEDGKFQVPFFDDSVNARCRTEKELRQDVLKLLSKYLRSPQVNVQVTERKSRPPATISGEVKNQQRVELRREARLLELISFAGGVTEEAGGMIQVFRTQPLMCSSEANGDENWASETNNGLDVPSRMYSLSSLRQGREESNPIIYPGDVIIVQKAMPVYITGEVIAPQGIYLKEGGTSLTEAIAKVNGVRREAKTKDIKIYRLKANSKEREVIAVNYDLIKKQKQKDIMLEPYDIIEVDKSKKSIAQTILEIATGVGKTAATGFGNSIPTSVLY